MNWEADKTWADRYSPEVERVVRLCAGDIISFHVASEQEDRTQATDYLARTDNGDIACRVRKWEYWLRFSDITIRSQRASGTKTELAKLREGFARWYLYGWAKEEDGSTPELARWVFLDVDKMRACNLFSDAREPTMNSDGRSGFVAYSLRELRHLDCVVRAHPAVESYLFLQTPRPTFNPPAEPPQSQDRLF